MRICAIGEAMLELSRQGDGWTLGYGGDTLNTALHLARYGLPVSYFSALGCDPFSDELRAAWTAQGLDVDLVLSDPDRLPGLYAIRTDDAGERTFSYWRGDSAARRMFDLSGSLQAIEKATDSDLVFYSLITLAILSAEAREKLFTLCRQVRARGGKVVFDGNYRPRLWSSPAEAIEARNRALAECDLGFPTLEDEAALCGATSAEAVAADWRAHGAAEVVVKLGAKGCLIADGTLCPPPERLSPVDTSGAGDAFNAGYLQAWLRGAGPAESAAAGHALAGWVILRRGAVPAPDAAAPYQLT